MSDASIDSPCTKVCAIDARTGWCEGCLRSLDEIAAWGALSSAERQAVWARLAERRALVSAMPTATTAAEGTAGAP